MRIEADWVTDPKSVAVMQALTAQGHEAYFVGGCVRNALLAVPVSDIDISTNAHPEAVLELAQKAGLRAVPTGLEHGTITLISDGKPFEVTTFRRDIETDGRRAVVAFADDIKEDAVRRDFTMNALYATPDGTLVDPLGGLPDLMARRVQFIQNPKARIEEDYLRILRFFRFHAIYGDPDGGMDVEALAGIAAGLDGIETLSKERIGAEMCKLLGASDPAPSLAIMAQTGVLMRVLLGADPMVMAPLVHLERLHNIAPDWNRRLAAIGGENPMDSLRLSKQEFRENRMLRESLEQDISTPRLAFLHGAQAAIDVTLIRAASLANDVPTGVWDQIDHASRCKFPITAADLIDTFQGKALGDRLAELQDRWIESGFALTRNDLLNG